MPKLHRADLHRNGLIIKTKESAVHFRISKLPCGPDKNGYYFYALTRIDAVTRKPMGKKQRISLSVKGFEPAKKKLKSIQFALQERTFDKLNQILFPEFIAEFDRSEKIRIKDGEISERTHAENMRYLEKFRIFIVKRFGSESVYLYEIGSEHARKFLETLTGRLEGQNGTRSRQYARNTLLRAFELAVADGKIQSNPFTQTKKITVKRKKPNPFTPVELRQLLTRLPDHTYEYRTWRNGIRFTYNTGVRNSELRRIRVKDIKHLEDGMLYVLLPITKNRKEHQIPITSEALEGYKEQIENLRIQFGENLSPDLPLFAGDTGKVLSSSTVSKWITKAIRKHAPDLKGKTFHCLRKTTADEVRKLAGLTTAKEVMNHSDERVTKRHYTTEDKIDLHSHERALSQMPRITPRKRKKGEDGIKMRIFATPEELLSITHRLN
jgi:integrase